MSEDSLISKVLGERYRVDELIGEGAMGRVYRAEHVLMRKRVALKVLHQELMEVPEIVERFEREARAAARIDHPHVAGATDFGKLEDGSFFLVLEFVEGVPLTKAIESGPMDLARVLSLAEQIASALEAAHAEGIIHRDLKPDNLLLLRDEGERAGDFIKVLDFGIAKVPAETGDAGAAITKVGVVYGTPEYMSPEQALGQEVDGRTDLYALGVVMYELLTGHRPYEGAAVSLLGQQLSKPIPKMLTASRIRVPAPVEELVFELLSTDMQMRVASATAVREQISALLKALAEGRLTGMKGARPKLLSLSLDEVSSRIGSVAQNLPAPVTRAVRSRLTRGILLALGFAILGVLGAVILVRTFVAEPASVVEAPPLPALPLARFEVPDTAPELEERLKDARNEGVDALEKLAQAYPTEGLVLAELSLLLSKQKRYQEATEAARSALALDPELNENAKIAGSLYRAAQSQKAGAAALRLLQGAMGSAGVGIIYDLAHTDGLGARSRREALRLLSRAEVRESASPAMLLVLDFEGETSCGKLSALVQRAELVGDKRVLPALKKLNQTTGCGHQKKNDCYPCLRGSDDLARAILTIEQRVTL